MTDYPVYTNKQIDSLVERARELSMKLNNNTDTPWCVTSEGILIESLILIIDQLRGKPNDQFADLPEPTL